MQTAQHAEHSKILVRPCDPTDIPAITAIYGHAVRTGKASFELEPPTADEMTKRRQTLLAKGYPYVVAEIGEEVVGYAYANAYRPRLAYAGTIENSVYVRDGFHGHGIGGALMRRLIAESERLGFRQMVAVIGDSANTASIRLHESLGFQHVGTLRSVGWKHQCWLDTVMMQLPIGAGDTTPR
ncbi:N-acetyltransferase family protein [Telmatospirillum sp.]|uniref:GNAT family N-acetyltransferase n=1 Tax=Telmatospirillum sp. TaxID=2079197 RepID=UPI0028408A39|nr:N-acetyltransferase family protein [Telmatospirillum sp.]MDR3437574.1 GNAT family N-acetyltransferase [Telmatospirillum sp.]